jgi:hypothetical protein
VKKLLLGLTVITFWSFINAAHKSQAPNPTAEDENDEAFSSYPVKE